MDTRPPQFPKDASNVARMRANLQDEADGAFVYGRLAAIETDAARREAFAELARAEQRHAELWLEKLRAEGVTSTMPQPTLKSRAVAPWRRALASTS